MNVSARFVILSIEAERPRLTSDGQNVFQEVDAKIIDPLKVTKLHVRNINYQCTYRSQRTIAGLMEEVLSTRVLQNELEPEAFFYSFLFPFFLLQFYTFLMMEASNIINFKVRTL